MPCLNKQGRIKIICQIANRLHYILCETTHIHNKKKARTYVLTFTHLLLHLLPSWGHGPEPEWALRARGQTPKLVKT